MAKITWAGSALLAPVPPVLVTTGTFEKPNICTVAWCGMLSTRPPKTYISLRQDRHSYQLLKENGEFVINLPTSALVRSIDYCGVRSGKDEDKFEKLKLGIQKATQVAPPLLEQSPVSIECRVCEVIALGTHDMFMADILAVNVNEELIDETGKLRLARAGLATYAHGEYFALGKRIGTFGFSVRKRKRQPVQNKQRASNSKKTNTKK